MSPDLINGLYEFGGGALLWLSVRAAYRAKEFKGVSIIPSTFFASWGLWNLYYYPALGQWFSFWGGVTLVIANLVWLGQMVYYRKRSPPVPNERLLWCGCPLCHSTGRVGTSHDVGTIHD